MPCHALRCTAAAGNNDGAARLFVGCLRAFVFSFLSFQDNNNNNMMRMAMLLLLYLQTPQHFCILLCFYTLSLYTHTHSLTRSQVIRPRHEPHAPMMAQLYCTAPSGRAGIQRTTLLGEGGGVLFLCCFLVRPNNSTPISTPESRLPSVVLLTLTANMIPTPWLTLPPCCCSYEGGSLVSSLLA